MDKKELNKKEASKTEGNNLKPKKMSKFTSGILGAIKLALGICLLPFVYSLTIAFVKELNLIDAKLQFLFWSGAISFLAIYLFIWEPASIYAKGQKIVEVIFQFFQPLVRFAPYLLPVYTIVLFITYALATLVSKSTDLINYFIFLFGFSITLHLVFSAKSIRGKQGDFLKANYIFGFSFIYILNIVLLAVGLSFIFKDFSLANLFSFSYDKASSIFCVVFRQLFLR